MKGILNLIKKDNYVTYDKLLRLRTKSAWYNIAYLAMDYGFLGVAIGTSIHFHNVFVYLLSILIIASRMRALENLLHEASHAALFKNRYINDLAGMLFCAFPIGSSMHAYRKSHSAHHSYLGNEKLDPDLIRYRKIGLNLLPYSSFKLAKQFARVILLCETLTYVKNSFSSFIYTKGTPFYETLIRVVFYGVIAGVLTYFKAWPEFILYWLIPFFTGFQIIRFFAEVSEHGGLYNQPNVILMTRNNLIHPFARFFFYPHGDAYHLTHHIMPAIPHYHLSKAHEILMTWEQYADAHHCYGYFNAGLTGLPTSFSEMTTSR